MEENSAKRTVLIPPITTLTAGMPILTIDFGLKKPSYVNYTQDIIPDPVLTNVQSDNDVEPSLPQQQATQIPTFPPKQGQQQPVKGKQTTFTALEDISILKAMRLYLGKNVSFKIPWSFWQLYRRSTGSQRSDSSLYHHWNGAMIKKYGNFIKEGRIDDCIQWAESALDVDSKNETAKSVAICA